MRQLSKWEVYLFLLGGLLMVVGAGANVLFQSWAPFVYALGALLFAAIQMSQRYQGRSIVLRRLRRIVLMSDVLFLLAALLMIANRPGFMGIDQLTYLKYIHNNWVVILLVAAVLQLYAGHRIANELEKEAK